jgi:hypothetical protein
MQRNRFVHPVLLKKEQQRAIAEMELESIRADFAELNEAGAKFPDDFGAALMFFENFMSRSVFTGRKLPKTKRSVS